MLEQQKDRRADQDRDQDQDQDQDRDRDRAIAVVGPRSAPISRAHEAPGGAGALATAERALGLALDALLLAALAAEAAWLVFGWALVASGAPAPLAFASMVGFAALVALQRAVAMPAARSGRAGQR